MNNEFNTKKILAAKIENTRHQQKVKPSQNENMKVKKLIAGVDEVGRGPLIGAVVTAAVILDPKRPVHGLADSKTLTEKRRETLAKEIREKALCWSLGRAEPEEIDALNILQATLLAMARAVHNLSITPDEVLIDGNRCPLLPMPARAIIKGDSSVVEISAASILAKTARDAEMRILDEKFPHYGFAQHKGYPTKHHLAMLKKYGPIPLHRRSFAPVRAVMEAQSF